MLNKPLIQEIATLSPPPVTHLGDAEQAIREKLLLREAQLSQAQRMAGLASWEWYFGDTQIRWSPEMYLFWGYEPNEITVDLDSVAQSTHLDDLPILQGAIAKVLQGNDLEVEYRRYDKLGREIFIHTIGRIIHNEAGDAIGVFGIDMNITKRKQQESELRRLNETLESKNRELEQRNAELLSFTYAASHHLQEPLRKIQSFNSLILAQEGHTLTEAAKDYFQRSVAAAKRMQGLVKDLVIRGE
jgi:PAS domain S-box-containing protein